MIIISGTGAVGLAGLLATKAVSAGMYMNGQFPFDKLIKTYPFEDINQTIDDPETGKIIKPVLLIGSYMG